MPFVVPSSRLPIPLVLAGLRLVPSAALVTPSLIIWRRMRWRHPRLMDNLARLAPALVHFEIADAPHIFTLRLGSELAFGVLLDASSDAPDACVKGGLAALVDLLEGRVDGDALFFARDIQITGNTEVIVGLRNTLDREEMDVLSEIISLCGPFETPARVAFGVASRLVHHVRQGVGPLRGDLNRGAR